jgi:hypothetical protein
LWQVVSDVRGDFVAAVTVVNAKELHTLSHINIFKVFGNRLLFLA